MVKRRTEEAILKIVSKLRVNTEIRAREVRLVGEKGEQLGVMPLFQAREVAKAQGLDLVEVAATAVPPVCRLLDFGKFKYEQSKKEKEAKKNQKLVELREVRIRPKIGEHDLDAKTRLAKKLLDEGDKVRITVMFRGREISHPEIAHRLMRKMAEDLKESATIERNPSFEGNRMFLILAPLPQKQAANKAEAKPEITESEAKVKEEVKKN